MASGLSHEGWRLTRENLKYPMPSLSLSSCSCSEGAKAPMSLKNRPRSVLFPDLSCPRTARVAWGSADDVLVTSVMGFSVYVRADLDPLSCHLQPQLFLLTIKQ